MPSRLFHGGPIVLPDRTIVAGSVRIDDGRITAVSASADAPADGAEIIDLHGAYLAPGFVDLHVHGGAGADFMDGTEERLPQPSAAPTPATARPACCPPPPSPATTSTWPSSTSAAASRPTRRDGEARVLGAHFYGPYFAAEARGCHPAGPVRPPRPEEYFAYLDYADCITTATVAPELPGAEAFVRACRARGVRCNAGHSHATFDQVEAAVGWGVRHVDHLFCAMSDRARLRQTQTYPMRGGLMEATLYFDELTTEVIADGKHLQRELLLLAYKIKGPDRLALVTDCNRALDMPDGAYVFGPLDGGEPILRRDGVGVTPDGKALASGVVGMDALRPHFPPPHRGAAGGGDAHGQPHAGPHRRVGRRNRQYRGRQTGRSGRAGRGLAGAASLRGRPALPVSRRAISLYREGRTRLQGARPCAGRAEAPPSPNPSGRSARPASARPGRPRRRARVS